MQNKDSGWKAIKNPEQIIAVWAEHCHGPGWGNTPIWVLVNEFGNCRIEVIQPEEQTVSMRTLFDVSHTVNVSMVAMVRYLCLQRKRKRKRRQNEHNHH